MTKRALGAAAPCALVLALGVAAACGGEGGAADRPDAPGNEAPQKTATADPAARRPAEPPSINGAGATFPYPVYAKWAHTYHKISGVELNYQSIGSGGGIAQIVARTVDFGASDAPMKAAQLEKHDLIQFPLVMGGVVPVVHLEGVEAGELKLTPELLARIYLGEIERWSDPAVAEANPGLELPDGEIAVVHRADGSGTTWIFTNYLSKVSPAWKKEVGDGKAVAWPTGIGGKGNEGVAAYVQRVEGSIGYVEFAYALQNEMVHVQLRNRAGELVEPTIESFQSAAANADWRHADGFYLVLTDQPGEKSWPITGASFILLHRELDRRVGRAMLEFFSWCYENGGEQAIELHYVPIPKEIVALIEDLWKRELRADGEPLWP